MKKNKRIAVASSILILFLAGCTAEVSEADIEKTIENGGAYNEEVVLSKDNSEIDSEVSLPEEEAKSKENMKILSTNNVTAESLSIDEDLSFIVDKVHEHDGYISSKDVQAQETSNKNLMEAKVVLRVPKEKLNDIIKDIKSQLTITAELVSSVDVTDEYYDIETRIENLEERESRLRKLYDSSDNIQEIIEIDDKLFEVTQEKEETIKRQLRMNDRVSFSRVDIEIKEVKKLSKVENENLSAKEKISESLSTTVDLIKSSIVWIISGLIKIGPGLLLAIVGFKIFKILKRKFDDFTSENDSDEIKKPSDEIKKPSDEIKKPSDEIKKPSDEIKKP